MTKFIDQTFERSPLSEIEKEMLRSLVLVTFLPASYDKRFCRSLSENGMYTWKQKRYLKFVFNKYRRQIKNYNDIALRMDPNRFDVEIKFQTDLFSVDGRADVTFKDTFKPSRKVS